MTWRKKKWQIFTKFSISQENPESKNYFGQTILEVIKAIAIIYFGFIFDTTIFQKYFFLPKKH